MACSNYMYTISSLSRSDGIITIYPATMAFERRIHSGANYEDVHEKWQSCWGKTKEKQKTKQKTKNKNKQNNPASCSLENERNGMFHRGDNICFRTAYRFVPSHWETALLCNDVSHWLGTNLESALCFMGDIMKKKLTYIWLSIFSCQYTSRWSTKHVRTNTVKSTIKMSVHKLEPEASLTAGRLALPHWYVIALLYAPMD